MPSSLFSSYLASGMRRSIFFPSDFGDREARVARVRAAARPVSPEVIEACWSRSPENLGKLRSGAAAVVIHPSAATPVDKDRRWTTLFERAVALHGNVRLLLRLPPPTGMR